jgi:hypothetical protein
VHFLLFKCFEKKPMVSGIYFIFQSGKNKIQMYTHKIKIQPNNVCINYWISKTWFSKSVSPKKRWVPQTKKLQIIVSYDKNSLILTTSHFLKRHLHLRNRLLGQGYKQIRLIRSLKKFIFRYQDLVEIYSVSAETIISDAFSYSENV